MDELGSSWNSELAALDDGVCSVNLQCELAALGGLSASTTFAATWPSTSVRSRFPSAMTSRTNHVPGCGAGDFAEADWSFREHRPGSRGNAREPQDLSFVADRRDIRRLLV